MSDATPNPSPAPSSQRLYATPPGLRLGPLAMVADGKARSIVVQMRAGRFHGFVVRHGDRVHGYVDRCPHAGVPLAQRLDDYLSPEGTLIACSFHGALFTIDTGLCIGGPCVGQHLTPWPVAVVDGNLTTAAIPLPPVGGRRRRRRRRVRAGPERAPTSASNAHAKARNREGVARGANHTIDHHPTLRLL